MTRAPTFPRAALIVLGGLAACSSPRETSEPAPEPLSLAAGEEQAAGARLAQEARAAALQDAPRSCKASSRSVFSLSREVYTARGRVSLSRAGYRVRGQVSAPSGETRELELARADGRYVLLDHTARTCTVGESADLGGPWSEELASLAEGIEALPPGGAGCRADGVEEFGGEPCRVLRLSGAAGAADERAWWIDSRALVRRTSARLALPRAETRVVTVTLERWGASEPGASIGLEIPGGYERREPLVAPGADEARAPLALDESLAPLRSAFERARDRLRLVVFLAPTCTSCLRVARAVDAQVLDGLPDVPLAVLVVWTDVLASDGAEGALRASAVFGDARVTQFHDPARWAGRAFAPLVGMPAASAVASGDEWERAFQADFAHGAPSLYDSVLFYAPGVDWTEPAPPPSAWVTQLDPEIWKGIDPAHFRYGDALRAELARLTEELAR